MPGPTFCPPRRDAAGGEGAASGVDDPPAVSAGFTYHSGILSIMVFFLHSFGSFKIFC